MATVLRRRPARKNNANKIVAQPAAFRIQPVVDHPLKALFVEDKKEPVGQSNDSESSGSHTGSNHAVDGSVSCVYDQKICATCASPASCCLCSTAYSIPKGAPWAEKLSAPGDSSSSTSGSETSFKAAPGWGQNETLFLAAAASLTALKGLVLALQRVSGRSWAEKALEAQANACMFWVQAAAHAVQPGSWKLGRAQEDELKARFSAPSSQRDAFHDAELLLALPAGEKGTEDRSEGNEKRRKRSASISSVMPSKEGWQPCLSFSPTLSSSPSGSSGFSFIQGDEIDGPSALERTTLETLVNNLMENPGSAMASQPTTPDQVCIEPLMPTASDKPGTLLLNIPQNEAPSKQGKRPASPPGAGALKVEKESVVMESIGEEDTFREVKVPSDMTNVTEDSTKANLFPLLLKKPAETLSRKQKKNLKKKNKKSSSSSLTVTPRENSDRPSSAK